MLLTSAALLSAPPAHATSVAEVLDAEGSLRRLEHLPAADYAAFRAAHEPELLAATAVLERAQLVEQAIVETHRAAEAEYGGALLCNLDEERMPTFDALAGEFVAEAARRAGQPEDALRERLLRIDIQEMLARGFLHHFHCPSSAVRLSAPENPPPVPPR